MSNKAPIAPRLLAGPIIRRTSPDAFVLWICTTLSAPFSATAYRLKKGISGSLYVDEPVGFGQVMQRLVLGTMVHISLIEVKPTHQKYADNELIAYDIAFEEVKAAVRWSGAASLSRMTELSEITLPGLPLPTLIAGKSGGFRALTGSCRKLHADGPDAAVIFANMLMHTASDFVSRPTALLLMGDQIYADDVAPHLWKWLTLLGTQLLGGEEVVPDVGPLSKVAFGAREGIIHDFGFTSTEAACHLLGLGEFISMYLVAWNPEMWPPALPPVGAIVREQAKSKHRCLKSDIRRLEENLLRARAGSGALRRAMANVPTYMLFDDHEVTDDWNLDREWQDRVSKSKGGRAVVASGLASYFAFQGWGNAPGQFGESLVRSMQDAVFPRRDYDALYRCLTQAKVWSFATATTPPVLFIDSRTQRDYQRGNTSLDREIRGIDDTGHVSSSDVPRLVKTKLLGSDAATSCVNLLSSARPSAGSYALVVVATPPFGLPWIESVQTFFAAGGDEYDYDYESWHANPESIGALIQQILLPTAARGAFFLAGDLHFAYAATGMLTAGGRSFPVGQAVTSALKNPIAAGARRLEQWFGSGSSYGSHWRDPGAVSDGTLLLLNSNKRNLDLERRARRLFGEPLLEEVLQFEALYGSTRMTTQNNACLIIASGDQVISRLIVTDGEKSMEGSVMRWAPSFAALRAMNLGTE